MFVPYYYSKAGGSSGLLMDLAANEKDVHADFFNGLIWQVFLVKSNDVTICFKTDFEDLCDEDEEATAAATPSSS